jgi:hypothetical protein
LGHAPGPAPCFCVNGSRGRGIKNRSVANIKIWQTVWLSESSFPHLDYLNMEETSSTAVAEPKKKSQEPGAKTKRLKGLRTNPDFAEAVSEERAAAKMWKDQHDNLHREYIHGRDGRSGQMAGQSDC